jgi:hypothetical protein
MSVTLPTLTREQWLEVRDRFFRWGGDAPMTETFGPCPPEPAPYWRCESAVSPADVNLYVSTTGSGVHVSLRYGGQLRGCVITARDARAMADALHNAARYVEKAA